MSGRRSSVSSRNQEADGLPDDTFPERHDQTRKAFKEVIDQASSSVLTADAGQEDTSKREAMDSLARGVDGLVTQVFDIETEVTRKRLKTQAAWYEVKLETVRKAAKTQLEHKTIEVKADCAAKFDQKLRALAEDGGSVEDGLMKRLDEQATEIARLQAFESLLTDTREQLALLEQEATSSRAELGKKTSECAKLEEESRLCQGLMARAATSQLGIDLQSAQNGASLRDVVAEFVDAFGDVNSLRDERDKLKADLMEETAAKEAAESAVATAAEDLAVARKSEADALVKLSSLENKVDDLSAKLDNATGLCETLEAAVESLKQRAEAADSALVQARMQTEQLEEQNAKLSSELASGAQERAKAEAAQQAAQVALEEAEKQAQHAEDQIVALTAEGAAAGDKIRSLESQVLDGEAKAELLRREVAMRETELRAARDDISKYNDELSKLNEQKEELENRCAQAKVALQEAEAEAERLVSNAEAEAAKRFGEDLERMAKQLAEATEVEQGLRVQIADMELRVALMEEHEAEAAHIREALAYKEREANEAMNRLDKIHSNSTPEVSEILEKMETMKKEMEKSKQQSKEKRAALVDSVLQSLMQLADHMAYMLAGIRLGQRHPAPPFQIRSCGPSPRGSGSGPTSTNTVLSRGWQKHHPSPEDLTAPPALCEATLQAVRDKTVNAVDRHVDNVRTREARIENSAVLVDDRCQMPSTMSVPPLPLGLQREHELHLEDVAPGDGSPCHTPALPRFVSSLGMRSRPVRRAIRLERL